MQDWDEAFFKITNEEYMNTYYKYFRVDNKLKIQRINLIVNGTQVYEKKKS